MTQGLPARIEVETGSVLDAKGRPLATKPELDAISLDMQNKIERGEGWVDLRKQANVIGDGTTDDSAAIQTVLNSAVSLGAKVYGYGNFGISSTITIQGPADLSQAVFMWRGAGPANPAVLVGGTVSSLNKTAGEISLPKVKNTKSGNGWAQANTVGSVGIKIQRLYTSTIQIPEVSNFETGLLLYGVTDGVSYNHIFLGAMENNKVNLKMDTDGVGWVNQNEFYGGRFSHYSNEGASPQTGVKHIFITRTAGVSGAPNTNTFYSCSLETPNVVEFMIDLDKGSQNCFYNCRFETTGIPMVRWGSEALYNDIDHGYQAWAIQETFVAGNIGNAINGARTRKRYVNGNPGEVLENVSSGTSPIFTFMTAGMGNTTADPNTAYSGKISASGWYQKASTDAFDRYSIVNGVQRFGVGTAAPSVGFSGTTTTILTTGHFSVSSDNLNDLGSLSARWRSLFLSGGLSRAIRFVSAAATIATNDSTVIFTGAAASNLTLPAAPTLNGREFTLRNNGTADVTVISAGGTIDKSTLAVGENAIYQSNGTNWFAIFTSAAATPVDSTDYLATYNTAKG